MKTHPRPRVTRRRQSKHAVRYVLVSFPLPMLERIDAAVARTGGSRQSWIKFQLAAVLDARQLAEKEPV